MDSTSRLSSSKLQPEDGNSDSHDNAIELAPDHHLVSQTLADNFINYIHTKLPKRLMIFKHNGWSSLADPITKHLLEGFRDGRSFSVFSVEGEPTLLIDFLSMVLINLRTTRLQSIAWEDVTGKRFWPKQNLLQLATPLEEVNAWALSCGGKLQGAISNPPPAAVEESSEAPLLFQPLLYPIVAKLERNSASFRAVHQAFLSGMGPFAKPDDVVHIFAVCSRRRSDAFEKLIAQTARERGRANVMHSWYASTDDDVVEALLHGFGHNGRHSTSGILGTGGYFTPKERAFASVRLCEDGKEGVQHMLLCRVIMGNAEEVQAGSNQHCPRSLYYDQGLDSLFNPKCYIVWPMHLAKYIFPEYLVCFHLSRKYKDFLCRVEDMRYNISDEGWAGVTGSLEPFLLLFEGLRERMSPGEQRLYIDYVDVYVRNFISREVLIAKVNSIVEEMLPDPDNESYATARTLATASKSGPSPDDKFAAQE